ncbi:MAG: tandem-95 repeat protein, partial [Aestuariibacter sp.]|nr:tandem-95 repeat protein [Aestuariibacter sp.]
GMVSFTYTASDGRGGFSSTTVQIDVNGTNDAPTLEVVSAATVNEDGSKTISFTAGDLDGTVSTAASANNGTVIVDENSGEITYTPDANFNGSDTITVTTTDNNGASAVKTVSVTVNEVNDAPIDISFSGNSVTENAAGGTVVANLSASDVDAGETLSYQITDDPSALFEVVGDQLLVKEGADIDYESAETHQLTIQVTDGSGAVYSESVTINVADVNEVP